MPRVSFGYHGKASAAAGRSAVRNRTLGYSLPRYFSMIEVADEHQIRLPPFSGSRVRSAFPSIRPEWGRFHDARAIKRRQIEARQLDYLAIPVGFVIFGERNTQVFCRAVSVRITTVFAKERFRDLPRLFGCLQRHDSDI